MYVDRSYLPFKSAREYQDRKMQKWLGFFLSEHTAQMKKFDQENSYVYKPGPQMDVDEIGQNLTESYQTGKRVEIGLNIVENQQHKKVVGVVRGYHDQFVLLEGGMVNLDDIRVVELLDDRESWQK